MNEENNQQNNLKFGRYVPVKILGEGAMGRVYLAEDPFLKRKLAIKVIILDKNLDDYTKNEYNQRFIVEAQASAKLNHPSIVTIHDVGNDNQLPWIVFEYVEGESLIDILNREKKVSLEKSITIALHIASALCVAHHHQIIHRDIKPANILIDSMTNIAKLADFGIAKAPWTELTQEGKTIGSPGYMSPEQIRGEILDERSDIFSLGVVLYQMITGTHPFLRDTMTNTLYATLEGSTKPLEEYIPSIPKALSEIVFACINPEKNKRISSAKELVNKLKGLHLASKTAHFTFTELKGKPAKVEIPTKALKIISTMTDKVRSSATVINTGLKKLFFTILPAFFIKMKESNPSFKHIVGGLQKRKSLFVYGSIGFIIIFFFLFTQIPNLIPDPEEGASVKVSDNMKGLEKVKMNDTEEQLFAQVKKLIADDDLDEAETIARTLSQTKNVSAYGYMLLGLIELKDEDYDDAFDAFEDCLKEKNGRKIIKQNLTSLLDATEEELQKDKADDYLLRIVVDQFKAAKNPIVDRWINNIHYWIRWNAVYIKEQADVSIDSVKVFILDLKHGGSVRTRVRAAKTLGRIGDKRAIDPLKEAARLGFSDPFVSGTAERVLEESFNITTSD